MYKVSYESLVIINDRGEHKPKDADASEKRQKGKVPVLAGGFRLSGGEEVIDKNGNTVRTGLWAYAQAMGVEMTREESHEAIAIFRDSHSEVVQIWYDLENAAFAALRGGVHRVGPVEFQAFGREPNDKKKRKLLRILLPSGRGLYYIRPLVTEREWYGKTKDALSYEGIDIVTKQWARVDTHGGKLVENIVQAIARDLLLNGMLLADEVGLELVGSCHDEIISLADTNGPLGLDDLRRCMIQVPEWADGLPLGAEGYEEVEGYYHK
jgi:DNA polymerase